MGFVKLQSLENHLSSATVTLDERLSGQITKARGFGRVDFDVVDLVARQMNLTRSGCWLLHDLEEHVQITHYLINYPGLLPAKVPWKTIQ